MTTFTPNISPAQAAVELREALAETTTVYVVQRRVSASGMNRKLSLFALDTSDGVPELVDITVKAAAVLDYRVHDFGGFSLSVNGAGMDMHFHVVYSLSRALYGDVPADERPALRGYNADRDAGYVLTKRTL